MVMMCEMKCGFKCQPCPDFLPVSEIREKAKKILRKAKIGWLRTYRSPVRLKFYALRGSIGIPSASKEKLLFKKLKAIRGVKRVEMTESHAFYGTMSLYLFFK